MLLREKLVQAELAAAKLRIREVGGNNHGPWVKKFLAAVGLPEGYAWCDAFQSYEMEGVAGHKLPIESASVGQTYATAKSLGWIVPKPARGDLVCYDFDGDGQFDDHIGLVVSVISLGPILTLETVEGNTSSGTGGSQGDGDGVFLRRRVISARAAAFVRIPGEVRGDATAAVTPDRSLASAKQQPATPMLKRGSKGPEVKRLQRLLRIAGVFPAPAAIDGDFGDLTYTAVYGFQAAHGLEKDGVVGPLTWAALDEVAHPAEEAPAMTDARDRSGAPT
jgi:putative peptidoglycan binding protein/CHAP domain-containing protein